MNYLQSLAFLALVLSLTACSRQRADDQAIDAGAAQPPGLIVAMGPRLIAPSTIAAFERSAGIKVDARVFPSQEEVEARVLAGKSGFDLVVLGASFVERQTNAGLFRPIDREQVPNLANIDTTFQQQAAAHDPGNALSVAFLWRALGIGINEQKIRTVWKDPVTPDWNVVFDRQAAARLQSCGIAIADSPIEVMQTMLRWMGREPLRPQPYDIVELRANLNALKPLVRVRPSADIATALANGELCAALLWTSDVPQGSGTVSFVVPESDSVIDFEMLAIPADAARSATAHTFINHLLDRGIAASNATEVHRSSTVQTIAATDAVESTAESSRGNPFSPALAPDVGIASELNDAWSEFVKH